MGTAAAARPKSGEVDAIHAGHRPAAGDLGAINVEVGVTAGNFGVGASDTGECVRIAAGDADFSVGLSEPMRFVIGARPHLAVARFER